MLLVKSRRASWRIGAVVMANVGVATATFAPVVNLLPRKVTDISPTHAHSLPALALVTGTGALAALLANLLAGWLSDRYLERLQGRRQWAALGVGAGFVALLLLAVQSSVPGLVLVWAAMQVAVNFLIAPLAAFLPDQVAPDRRGQVSAMIALGLIVGVVASGAVGAATAHSTNAGFVIVAFVYLLLTAPAVMSLDSRESIPAPVPAGDTAAAAPKPYADFRWAWLTRFVILLSAAIALLYLYYYLTNVLHVSDPSQRQFELLSVMAIFLLVGAVSGGRISDRSGRRKPVLMASLIIVAGAQLILAAVPHWPATVAAAALVGLGFGGFMAVDQALSVDVLPKPARYALDLSIMNISSTAPQIIAPAIAAALTSAHSGYFWLYCTAGLLTLAATGFVRAIRTVR